MKPAASVAWLLGVALLAVATARVYAQGQETEAARAARAASDTVQQAQPAATSAAPAAAPKDPPAKGKPTQTGTATATGKQKAVDRLELERTQITGNRELPKVMVIVPWKRSDIGDLARRPFSSLVDEALAPVDRAAFRREVDYYDTLAPERRDPATPVTGGAPNVRPEK